MFTRSLKCPVDMRKAKNTGHIDESKQPLKKTFVLTSFF